MSEDKLTSGFFDGLDHTRHHGRSHGFPRNKGVSAVFSGIKSADGIVEGAETVTGNYRTTSGTPGGGLQSPRTVMTAPTSCGRTREKSPVRKGVKL